MQAFDYERYGPPETLRMVEVDTPTPNAEEVLVTARELELQSGPIEAGRLRARSLGDAPLMRSMYLAHRRSPGLTPAALSALYVAAARPAA